MAAPSASRRSSLDIWPGFVDGLAALVMVIIFLLMIFVVAQFYLSDALLGRDKALESLNQQVAELAELLDLERKSSVRMRRDLAELSSQLQRSTSERDELQSEVGLLRDDLGAARRTLEQDRTRLTAQLEEAYKAVEADKEKIQVQLRRLAQLQQDIAAMEALKKELEKELKEARVTAGATQALLASEREISAEAKAQIAMLNRQMSELRSQLAALNAALDASEARDREQKAKIADLGQRLNVALAQKVQELSRYRSEFFGRLRVVLGDHANIRVVGDRFVFQSEVLFASGSADLEAEGQKQLGQLAKTLLDISKRIPPDIDWVLRIDGHTDHVPIATDRFPSNWELSAARAISVVRFLISQGIPPERLAATGFGEFHPIEPGRDEKARQRNRRIEMKLDQR